MSPHAPSYLALVHRIPCVLCRLLGRRQTSRTVAHHPRDGVGLSQRAGDFCTIALCEEECHRGPLGIHGDRTYLRMAKVTEWDLHDLTNEAVFALLLKETGFSAPF